MPTKKRSIGIVLLAAAIAGGAIITMATTALRSRSTAGGQVTLRSPQPASRPFAYRPGHVSAARQPAAPSFVERGYIPATAVSAPPIARPPLPGAGRAKRLLQAVEAAPHNPGGVNGDRPPRPIPGLR